MQQTKTSTHCWKLTRFSLWNTHYAFVDTENYYADQLFIKHCVPVRFGNEFVSPDNRYRIIFCRMQKRDEAKFLAAMEELPNKMLLCGHRDYLHYCDSLRQKINMEVSQHEELRPTEQTE